MGKLFGGASKERKAVPDADSQATLNAFLHGSADSLTVTHAPPPPPTATAIPKLSKLDTSTISRFPQALAVNQQAQQNRPVAPGKYDSAPPRRSPRPNKKGFLVRFVDTYPVIIGEGGDECEFPTMEIARRKQSMPPEIPTRRRPIAPGTDHPGSGLGHDPHDDFQPKPLMRKQTAPMPNRSLSDAASSQSYAVTRNLPQEASPTVARSNTLKPGKSDSARFLDAGGRYDDNRRSFIEIHQAEMREAEGQAFAEAARVASAATATSPQNWEESEFTPATLANVSPDPTRHRPLSMSPEPPSQTQPIEYSPAASIQSDVSSLYPTSGAALPVSPEVTQAEIPPAIAARAASLKLHDQVTPLHDGALDSFIARTRHLHELFRLHAETVKPLSTCLAKDCARAGLWWFLRGRLGLEAAVRERPTSSQSQMQNELDRQQAYTNLAKGYWLSGPAIDEISYGQQKSVEREVEEVREGLTSGLRKLSESMQRNGFLPPEEAFLPQTIDKSIWVEYPALSQDMIALLSGNWGSGMSAMQSPMTTLHLLDAFPVSDTQDTFSYGRLMVDVFLMELGRESHRLYFPCLLSMVRPQGQTGLVFVIASQNGNVQLAIQENRNAGPVWEDVKWRSDSCTLEIKLPRGFIVAVQLSQTDYRMVAGMYEFGSKVNSTLFARSDEMVVFRNTLRSFQYIDSDPQSRLFPKDPVPHCEVAVFERIFRENGPSGPRSWHNGFRIAVVTGTRTRTLSGVQHAFPPLLPVQFGFLRSEGEAPALSIRYESGRQRGRMVMTFNDEKERLRFHALVTGTAVNHDEKIFTDVGIRSYTISQSMREPTGMAPFSRLPWKAARVVNEEFGPNGEVPTVLADKLRIVVEHQFGTVTDRVNVEPGELRVRLEVSNSTMLRLLRQPQGDVTMAVSEGQVPKELPRNLADSLQLVKSNSTIRSLEFGSVQELHAFQAALTGFEVIFDGRAAFFAIARRRMVVPIHKKWEAGYTRIQIVKQEDKQLQLLAFFEDFHHGHCMNFVLKGTDVYESFSRSSKAGIRFVDAKFPLPRVPIDQDGDYDDMAFVCLDLPDLPGEHDDISIAFENEAGKNDPFNKSR